MDVTIQRCCKCLSPLGWCWPPAKGTVHLTIHCRLRCLDPARAGRAWLHGVCTQGLRKCGPRPLRRWRGWRRRCAGRAWCTCVCSRTLSMPLHPALERLQLPRLATTHARQTPALARPLGLIERCAQACPPSFATPQIIDFAEEHRLVHEVVWQPSRGIRSCDRSMIAAPRLHRWCHRQRRWWPLNALMQTKMAIVAPVPVGGSKLTSSGAHFGYGLSGSRDLLVTRSRANTCATKNALVSSGCPCAAPPHLLQRHSPSLAEPG